MDVDFTTTPPRRPAPIFPSSVDSGAMAGGAGAAGLRLGPLFGGGGGAGATGTSGLMTTTTTPTRPAAGTPSRSLLASPSSLSRPRPPPSPLTFADRHVPSARSLFGGGATATIAAAAAASPFDAALALDEQRRGGGAGTAAAGAAASRSSSSSSSRGGVGGAGGVVGTSGSATAGANAAALDAGGNQGNARPSSAGGNGQGASTYGALLRAQLLGAAAAGTGAGAAGGAGTATTGPAAAAPAAAAAPSPTRPRQQQHFGSPSAAAASATTPATPSRRPRILSFVHDDASAAFASPARRSINAFGSGIGGGGGNNDVDDFRFDDDDGVLLQNHHSSPQQRRRRVPRAPFKILDAPALADDFYLNLVDWSSQNVLAVGLGPCVYLWSAATSGVTKLCDLSEESEIASAASALARAYPGGSAVPQIQAGVGDAVCSVSWSQRGQYLAVGTGSGLVQVFDVARAGESGGGGQSSSTSSSSSAKLRTYAGHRARVSSLSWGSATLSTGSRDRSVAQRDVRCPEPLAARLSGHRSEVCGLRASPDDRLLASGGNDNALLVWDTRRLFSSSSSSSSSGAGGGQGGGGGGQQRWRQQQQQQQQRRQQQQHRLMQRSGGGAVAASNSSSSASAAAAAAAAAAEAAEYSGGLDESSIPNVSTPLFRFTEHTAAVKALAWSPHAHGLLASGGGTADRCIRFWSTTGSGNGGNGSAASDTLASASAPNTTAAATSNNDACLGAIDTGSQVCNLAWAKHANELASTHGYSQNAVALWRYPTMARVATLTGHSTRVLYLAASPDGRSIVTGAGDETLRFWSVFPGPRGESNGGGACGLGGASRARGGGGVGGGAVVASSPAGKGHAAATTPLSGLARSWLR